MNKYVNNVKSTIDAINEDELLNKEQIAEIFELTEEQVKEIIDETDFQDSVRFAGDNYWLKDHVKMMVKAKGHRVIFL